MNSTKRIIIYRVGAIGDVIHTLPFVKLLRKNNPDAQIEYIVGSQQLADLLEQCTNYIDKVWLVKKKTLAADMSIINTGSKIDEFIFLHSGRLKAWWLNLRFIKAPKLSIYKRDDSLSAVANYVTSYYSGLKQQLLVDPFSILEWKTLMPISNNAVPIAVPYVCIVPGVGNLRPHRAYPLNKWLDLINEQLRNTDNNIILLGGPDETNLSTSLEEAIQDRRVMNLIGKTSLVELVNILPKAEHLYSADTGILHIGAAVGVSITAVFSITSEKRFGPFSPYATVLRSSLCNCNPSATNRPKHCSSLVNSYAKCMQYIEISSKAFIENHS